jgi:hypothetical protein
MAVVFSISVAMGGKEFFDQMDQVAKQVARQNPDAAQLVQDPLTIFFMLLIVLAIMGAAVIGVCAAGGALGARFAARKANG